MTECYVSEGLEEEARRDWREVCRGLRLYDEHEGEQYCVLHFPSPEKNRDDFKKAMDNKLDGQNYDFRGVVFPEGTSEFEGREFDANVNFGAATFFGTANFRGATFEEDVDVSFNEATFHEMANFRRANFQKDVDFYATVFNGEARFRRTTFAGSVNFQAPSVGHSFNARANFSMAIFKSRVRFIGRRTFDAWVGEDDATKERQAEEKPVTFRDALIEKPESFSLDRVQLRPSWFIDTNVRNLRFTNVQWSGLSKELDGSIQDELLAVTVRRQQDEEIGGPHEVLAKACRELSANAEDNREYPLANEFYYWSMEALRKKKDGSRVGLITTLYWTLSGYGVRPGRALGVLLAIGGVFAVLFTLFGPPELQVFTPTEFWKSIGNFGQALVYSAGALARLGPEPKPDEPGLFQLLVIAAGLLGPLQIGLLLLSVRRKVMR